MPSTDTPDTPDTPDARDAGALSGSEARLRKLLMCIVAAAGVVVYLNSFAGDFIFDDRPHILINPSVQDLSDMGYVLRRTRRPVVNLSLAVNYALGGGRSGAEGEPDPFTFHLFNLLVHLAGALVLYALVQRCVRLGMQGEASAVRRASIWIAFGAALLWVVHPLTTAAVTYIIQRAEALMAVFYLLTLYATLRCAGGRRAVMWGVVAVIACGLGMLSKAVMLTAPIAAVLIDRCFITGSFRQTLRARWALWVGLGATWLMLVVTGLAQGVLNPGHQGPATVGFAVDSITPTQYLLTQPGVILHYLRLAVYPVGLVLDYAWPMASAAEAAVPFILVSGLFLLSLYLLWRRPALGFPAVVFFLVLGPTSSFVPMDDLANDHRMYLPLACVVSLTVVGMWRVVSAGIADHPPRRFAAVVSILAMALGVGTIIRNVDYRSDARMWADVLDKRPGNPRAHLHVAISDLSDAFNAQLSAEQRNAALSSAVAHLREAVALDAEYAEAHMNLGSTLGRLGRLDEAIAHLERAAEIKPHDYQASYLLGVAYRQGGLHAQARASFDRVLDLRPQHVYALNQYGLLLMDEGNAGDAARMFERALNAPARTALDRREQEAAERNLARARASSGAHTSQ